MFSQQAASPALFLIDGLGIKSRHQGRSQPPCWPSHGLGLVRSLPAARGLRSPRFCIRKFVLTSGAVTIFSVLPQPSCRCRGRAPLQHSRPVCSDHDHQPSPQRGKFDPWRCVGLEDLACPGGKAHDTLGQARAATVQRGGEMHLACVLRAILRFRHAPWPSFESAGKICVSAHLLILLRKGAFFLGRISDPANSTGCFLSSSQATWVANWLGFVNSKICSLSGGLSGLWSVAGLFCCSRKAGGCRGAGLAPWNWG